MTSDYHVHTYGDEVAHTLASAWVHKVSYFFDGWVRAGKPDVMDWVSLLADYKEPDALATLETTEPPVVRQRLGKLRKLRPH